MSWAECSHLYNSHQFGIVPIYRAADGSQFPPDAKEYPANS